jgi:predicted transcriptional regulator
MEPKYATLKTIYEIVKNESNPITYHCTPTQVILRQTQPWDSIMEQLYELEAEELITIQKPGKAICITTKGMDKIQSPELFIYS